MKVGTDFDGLDVEMFAAGGGDKISFSSSSGAHAPICLSWQDVKYSVINKSWKKEKTSKGCCRLKRASEKVDLLRSVSGIAYPGECVAIIGG